MLSALARSLLGLKPTLIPLSSSAKADDPVLRGVSVYLKRRRLLDAPLEPVIGRRFAPTRWRGMTE